MRVPYSYSKVRKKIVTKEIYDIRAVLSINLPNKKAAIFQIYYIPQSFLQMPRNFSLLFWRKKGGEMLEGLSCLQNGIA